MITGVLFQNAASTYFYISVDWVNWSSTTSPRLPHQRVYSDITQPVCTHFTGATALLRSTEGSRESCPGMYSLTHTHYLVIIVSKIMKSVSTTAQRLRRISNSTEQHTVSLQKRLHCLILASTGLNSLNWIISSAGPHQFTLCNNLNWLSLLNRM